MEKIRRDKPSLVIGSPTCTDWSTLMNFNWGKLGAEENKRRMKDARGYLRFCVKVYQHQVKEGRYYTHGHPMGAGSWQEPGIKAMIRTEQNILAKLDQCQYGWWIKNKNGRSFAKKPTKF